MKTKLRALAALLLVSMLPLLAGPVLAAPGDQGKGHGQNQKAAVQKINELRKTLRESGGGLSRTDVVFLAFLRDLSKRGIDIIPLLDDDSSFLGFTLGAILFGSIDDHNEILKLWEILRQLIEDGSLDDSDIFILTVAGFLLDNGGELTDADSSLLEVIRKLAAAGLDLPTYTTENPAMVSALINLVNTGFPISQFFCDLIDELAEDGSLDSNDLFILTVVALTFENTDGTANAANHSLAVVLKKLADAGVDIAAFTKEHPSLVSGLFALVNNVPPTAIPQAFCDLIDSYAADGTLDETDLFALSLVALSMEQNEELSDAALILADIIQILAEAGISPTEYLADNPDGFLSTLFLGVLNGEISTAEAVDIHALFLLAIEDGFIDPAEEALLIAMVDAAASP